MDTTATDSKEHSTVPYESKLMSFGNVLKVLLFETLKLTD